MASHYGEIDRSKLTLAPLASRRHDLDLSVILNLDRKPIIDPALQTVAGRIREVKGRKAATILMMGAHVIRSGVQRYIIDLMEQGYISCLAMNGAGVIHDFELSLVGGSTESVAHYIRDGRFGMWHETGQINDIVAQAAQEQLGLGEAVGKVIEEECFPQREISLLAAGYRLGIPVTVHVGIGQDIVHQLPNCDGAAYGATSYRDFLRYAGAIENLEGGVVMNFGSAVMGPEIFLKALSMARNIARQRDKTITHFTTLVCDLTTLPDQYRTEAPKTDPNYYFRPWKTMLVRTVADGGQSHYVCGRHADTIPQLWSAITTAKTQPNGGKT